MTGNTVCFSPFFDNCSNKIVRIVMHLIILHDTICEIVKWLNNDTAIQFNGIKLI